MEEINHIYNNKFGIAFYWKRTSVTQHRKVQLVFRDIGMLLKPEELELFANKIRKSLSTSTACDDCPKNGKCKHIVLESPVPQISLVVSFAELKEIEDLVRGTLFEINFNSLVDQITRR